MHHVQLEWEAGVSQFFAGEAEQFPGEHEMPVLVLLTKWHRSRSKGHSKGSGIINVYQIRLFKKLYTALSDSHSLKFLWTLHSNFLCDDKLIGFGQTILSQSCSWICRDTPPPLKASGSSSRVHSRQFPEGAFTPLYVAMCYLHF